MLPPYLFENLERTFGLIGLYFTLNLIFHRIKKRNEEELKINITPAILNILAFIILTVFYTIGALGSDYF